MPTPSPASQSPRITHHDDHMHVRMRTRTRTHTHKQWQTQPERQQQAGTGQRTSKLQESTRKHCPMTIALESKCPQSSAVGKEGRKEGRKCQPAMFDEVRRSSLPATAVPASPLCPSVTPARCKSPSLSSSSPSSSLPCLLFVRDGRQLALSLSRICCCGVIVVDLNCVLWWQTTVRGVT